MRAVKRKGMVPDPLAAPAPTMVVGRYRFDPATDTSVVVEFDGATFESGRDAERLTMQLAAVRTFMSDHEWHTLAEISRAAGGAPEASVSARLRDLRKFRFGGYAIEREYVSAGLWRYRMGKVLPFTIGAIPEPTEWVCTERDGDIVCGQHIKRDGGLALYLGGWATTTCPARTCPSRDAKGNPTRRAIFKPVTARKDDEK